MKSNVGSADRVVRAILGIGIIAFAVVSHGPIRWVGVVGLVLVATATMKFCPAYGVMKIRTIGTAPTQFR